VAAMKAAKTADQQSRAEQKEIFFGLFLLFFVAFYSFFGSSISNARMQFYAIFQILKSAGMKKALE